MLPARSQPNHDGSIPFMCPIALTPHIAHLPISDRYRLQSSIKERPFIKRKLSLQPLAILATVTTAVHLVQVPHLAVAAHRPAPDRVHQALFVEHGGARCPTPAIIEDNLVFH